MSCNSTYRLRYWNSGLNSDTNWANAALQQYLPFTVLKHAIKRESFHITFHYIVATVLTVYGIETFVVQ